MRPKDVLKLSQATETIDRGRSILASQVFTIIRVNRVLYFACNNLRYMNWYTLGLKLDTYLRKYWIVTFASKVVQTSGSPTLNRCEQFIPGLLLLLVTSKPMLKTEDHRPNTEDSIIGLYFLLKRFARCFGFSCLVFFIVSCYCVYDLVSSTITR